MMITSNTSIILRLLVTVIGSLIAIIFPLLLYIYGGIELSLSRYVIHSPGDIIFNISVVFIAFSLSIRKVFIFPSILLLCIVFFDVVEYPILHNILAALFFLIMAIIMSKGNMKYYGWLMFINAITLFVYGMLLFEFIGILLIILYNLHIMLLIMKNEYVFKSK